MSKKDELEKADRAIKDAEQRLRAVKNSLEAIEKEVDILSTLETQLEANVKFLKKKNIIALAAEYKKAREDLIKTKTRLGLIKTDREKIRNIYHEIELAIFKAKQSYDENIKESENNVIRGKFGRQDG